MAKGKLLFCFFLLHHINVVHGVSPDSLRSTAGYSPQNSPVQSTWLLKIPGTERDELVVPQADLADSLVQQRSRAHELREAVEGAQRFRESLDAFSVIDLPIGVVRSGGILDYSILIDRVTFTPSGAVLDAYMSFVIPQTGDRIAFGGKVPLSKDGGIVGIARIYLLGDHTLKLDESTLFTLKGSRENGTFVDLDCDGFRAMGITAEIEFSRDLIIPEDNKGNMRPTGRVKIEFKTLVQEWNELMLQVSLPPFQINGLKDVSFRVQEAYLDWSDLTNPPGLVFPKNYESAWLGGGSPNLWRGFFMRRASVQLPPQFTEGEDTVRTAVLMENLVIDETGVSGSVSANNVLQRGSMDGWQFSLDAFQLGMVSNQLQAFDLSGRLTLPVFKIQGEPARMAYRASLNAQGNYLFSVGIQQQLKLPLWAADVVLNPGSSITVTERNNKFYPSATLNGMLSISAGEKGPETTITGVRFEQLVLSTEAPYFRAGTFGIGSGQPGASASKFPLVIRNIGVRNNAERQQVGISFDVQVNIGGNPQEEGFSGGAGLIIWGSMRGNPSAEGQETPQSASVKFDRVEITAISLAIRKKGVYDIAGDVRFFEDDPTYGDGFRGELQGGLQDIQMSVGLMALFGRTPTYRYWFVDALVGIERGVAIAPGLGVYGFGGGFYSRMKQSAEGFASVIGMAPSGITYVPDAQSMGLRAFVEYGSHPEKSALQGDVTLEVAMNRHGGINRITLTGNAFFLSPALPVNPETLKAGAGLVAGGVSRAVDKLLPKAQVYGNLRMTFDNENNVFHGNIDVFVNVAGGVMRGIGEQNRAGWAELHFEPSTWHVLVGTPNQPVGVQVARIFQSRSYFMMGKNLPGSPPPPQRVSAILGNVNLDYMRDWNALQSGTGMAFGLSFGVDTGDLRFLMFYGRFNAGTGLDMMLKDYGQSYHCSGSGESFGINGWFANGQAYAFVEGKIGVKVNLRFYKGDYDILAIGAAAVLQAKGPNPFWMKGIVGGHYSILGGLVKGDCRFEVVVGKECTPVGESNPLADVGIIAGVTPVKGLTEVDVFTAPQAAFNIAIGQNFEITDVENIRHTYRARLDEFSVREGGNDIEGTMKWNAGKDVVVKDSRDILPSRRKINVVIRVVFEEWKDQQWQTVVYDGKPVIEVGETEFTTGDAPDHLPANNVELSYPLAGQYNFYTREYGQGFIRLKKGMPELFTPGPEWLQKGRMVEVDNAVNYLDVSVSYDAAQKTVNFNIPDNLPLGKVHRLELVNIPRSVATLDANVTASANKLTADERIDAKVTTKQAAGQVALREEKRIFESYFRTSLYRLLSEKLAAMRLSETFTVIVSNHKFQLGAYISSQEYFDNHELGGDTPLITMEAELEKTPWYSSQIFPLVYEGFPLLGRMRVTRADDVFGLPPRKSLYFFLEGRYPAINDEGTVADYRPSIYSSILYDIQIPMLEDYLEIQRQVVNYLIDNPLRSTERLSRIVLRRFPPFAKGSYPVTIQYKVPGQARSGSTYGWVLTN